MTKFNVRIHGSATPGQVLLRRDTAHRRGIARHLHAARARDDAFRGQGSRGLMSEVIATVAAMLG